MKFALALFALLFSLPASASTYRVDMEGSFQTIEFFNVLVSDQNGPSAVNRLAFDLTDPAVASVPRLNLAPFSGTSGSAMWDDGYSNCTGILQALCFGVSFQSPVDGVSSGSGGSQFTVTDERISFVNDAFYSWSFGGVSYSTANGASISGEVTSLSVTPVPIPAAGFLLAFGLFILRLLRRRQGQTADFRTDHRHWQALRPSPH